MFRIFARNLSLSPVQYKTVKTPVPVFGIEGRYVQALYSAASQKNELDQVEKFLRDLHKELLKPKVKDFIDTSMISRSAKAKLLLDVAKSIGMPSTGANFLAAVAENGRLKSLRKIISMFMTVMVAHRDEAECEVLTATPLEAQEREALMAVLKKFTKGKKKISLTERVDPDVIGGIVVGIEDKHIDLSLYTKILMYTAMLKRTA